MLPSFTTIPISHYGERARWALDLSEVDYEERHHLQMFSWGVALRGGGKKTLPILVTPDEVLRDSAQIVRWASDRGARLFPESASERREVERLSAAFADELGVETRRFAYDSLLGAGKDALVYNAGRCPPVESYLMNRGFSITKRFAIAYLGVRMSDLARALVTIDRFFDDVAKQLADGRRYLVGDRFTAADLTFAAMAAPCILPERYGVTLPAPEELAPSSQARIQAWRDHPAGQLVMRLYAERPPPRGRFIRPLRAPPRASGFPA